jgi:hypothetical protein
MAFLRNKVEFECTTFKSASIILIPTELILDICKYLKKEIIEKRRYFWHNIYLSYPVWCLYATCKSFNWLGKLEYLWAKKFKSGCYYIISGNIGGRFNGFLYQMRSVPEDNDQSDPPECILLMGYFASNKPKTGYNYSRWCSDDTYFYRGTSNDDVTYYDYLYNQRPPNYDNNPTHCYRYRNGSCKKNTCRLCVQLDAIQENIFKQDRDVETIYKNIHEYINKSVLIRIRKPVLDFKFDYVGFNVCNRL